MRLGAVLLLQDVATIASYLRAATTTALGEVDRTGQLLSEVAKGLDSPIARGDSN